MLRLEFGSKTKACTVFGPMISAMLVQCSTDRANKLTGSRSFCWFKINP